MALVTIERSPSPSNDPESDIVDGAEDAESSKSPLRQRRSKTALKKLRKFFNTVRFITKLRPCLSESYFTVKGAALILPQSECSRRTSKKNHGGDMQHHLQAMLHILRPEDKMKMAVKLENSLASSDHRYLALVSTIGRQDEEEAVILGIDYSDTASLGLVIPILSGTKIRLDGDGGFTIQIHDGHHYIFKPVSVQVMWSAIQSIEQAINMADRKLYTSEGLSHTWLSYYNSKIDKTDKDRISQWHFMEGVLVNLDRLIASQDSNEDEETAKIKKSITQQLYEVMMQVDLDEATSKSLRLAVEEKLGISVIPYRTFFDLETMRILGQMDQASEITDFVYLGSEWNAANVKELKHLGIGYILNVTREIDNFFQGMFQYKNIRLYDQPESDLLKHWNKTYDFIDRARKNNSKILIHCKMGISRSASTAMAFLMKDNKWSLDEAYKYVQNRRACVNPNSGFMEQLKTYEGILTASNQRHTFHNLSEQDPKSRSGSIETEDDEDFLDKGAYVGIEPSELPLCKPNVKSEEEWIAQLPIDNVSIPLERDLETGSRSADSMEESLPDIPSPPPPDNTKTRIYHFNQLAGGTTGEVAGSELPYSSTSEDSEEEGYGVKIQGAYKKHSEFTIMSSSVPSHPTFKDDVSWIKPHQSDEESTPSVEQCEVPVLILASDFIPHKTDNNFLSKLVAPVDSSTPVALQHTAHHHKSVADPPRSVADHHTLAPSYLTSDATSPTVDQTCVTDNQHSSNIEMIEGDGKPHSSDLIYAREDIPWSSGQVLKIRDELTSSTYRDSENNVNQTASNVSPLIMKKLVTSQDFENAVNSVQKVKKTERTTPGMKCSHSCSELLSMDNESERPSKRQCGATSVYDKEDIELTEGIVMKTKMEIEQRNKPSDIASTILEISKTIQRSASLKEATEIAKAKRAERRKTIVTYSPSRLQSESPVTTSTTSTSSLISPVTAASPSLTSPVTAISSVTRTAVSLVSTKSPSLTSPTSSVTATSSVTRTAVSLASTKSPSLDTEMTKEMSPRPLFVKDEVKRRISMPETSHPEVLISGVTLDESTDGATEDITVYRYGSEEVPLKSGIVKKYKQGYEHKATDVSMDTSDIDGSVVKLTEVKTNITLSTSSYIPSLKPNITTMTKTTEQKTTESVKSDSQVIEGQGHISIKKEKCPYNKEELEYIKDVGSMLSPKSAKEEDDNEEPKSAVISVVRNIERKSQERKIEKKIVIIDSDSKKSKHSDKIKAEDQSASSKNVSQRTESSQIDTEMSGRSGLNLDLIDKIDREAKESADVSESSLPGSQPVSIDSDQSVVRLLLGKFEQKDTSPIVDTKPMSLGVCVAKVEPGMVSEIKSSDISQATTIITETIIESEEDEHLQPEYIEMRNNLHHVHPSVTQRYRAQSSDIAHRHGMRTKSVSDAPSSQKQSEFQTGEEMRRVRRNQFGASHPLTRLGASPFYNTM